MLAMESSEVVKMALELRQLLLPEGKEQPLTPEMQNELHRSVVAMTEALLRTLCQCEAASEEAKWKLLQALNPSKTVEPQEVQARILLICAVAPANFRGSLLEKANDALSDWLLSAVSRHSLTCVTPPPQPGEVLTAEDKFPLFQKVLFALCLFASRMCREGKVRPVLDRLFRFAVDSSRPLAVALVTCVGEFIARNVDAEGQAQLCNHISHIVRNPSCSVANW